MAKTTMETKIDSAALNQMLKSPNGMVGQYMVKTGNRIVKEARESAPHKTGRLQKSIGISTWPGSRLSLEITANVPYALAVHNGSKPHEITGHPILKFPSRRGGGKIVELPKVHHPGNKANPFLVEAMNSVINSH